MKIIDVLEGKITGEWGNPCDSDEGIMVLRTTNFTNEGVIDYSNIAKRCIDKRVVEKKKLKVGDIIIEKSGGGPAQPVGRVVFFDRRGAVYLCNNFTSILRPNKKVFPKYLFYILFYKHLSKRILKYQNKTTGIINLQLDRYLQEELILPPITKQANIVQTLDAADILRQKRKEQIKLLDDYLKSVFYKMFGDPINNPKKLIKRQIGDLGQIITGNTPSRQKQEYYGDYIEWIKSDNINTPEFTLTKAEEYLSKKGLEVGRKTPAGSVLVTCIAGSRDCIGNVAITDREVAFNQQINAFVPGSDISYKLFFAQIQFCKQLIRQASTNSMKGMVSKNRFAKIDIIVPLAKEQKKFEKIFDSVLEIRQKIRSSLSEMDNHFNALMQKSFG